MTTTLQRGDVVVTASGVLYELRNILPSGTYVLAPPAPWVKVSPLYADQGRPAKSSRRVATPPRFVSSDDMRVVALYLRRAQVATVPGALRHARHYLTDTELAGRDTSEMLDRARAELERLTTLEVTHDG